MEMYELKGDELERMEEGLYREVMREFWVERKEMDERGLCDWDWWLIVRWEVEREEKEVI